MSTKPTLHLDAAQNGTAEPENRRARSKAKSAGGSFSAQRLAPLPANDEPVADWADAAAGGEPDHDQAAALAALAEPIRRELVERLLDQPSPVGRLAEGFTVSRAAISQHLKVLLDAGVVGYHKRGPLNIYSVKAEPLLRLEGYVHELARRARAGGLRRNRWFERS